ncbi:MAG TPA: tyrosine-type recombinase/integrase, partial [Gemmataceae bacterium]|nr:tyrosine-type recombinase/integrase [Gemmataceae bacterium]
FPHATRRWAKKIRGQMHYFGPWEDADGALQKYLDQKDDLYAGRTPRVTGEGLTVRDLLNRFLTSKRHLVDTRELTERTFADYFGTCKRIGEAFGLRRLVSDLASDDFERLRTSLAKTLGPVALGNEIQRVRTVFKYADDEGLIDRPVRYGSTFRKPSKKVLRKARQAKGIRMFEAAEIRALLAKASTHVRAMILLGINCGFGNSDCGNLSLAALDLEKGWVNFPRPKTGIERRCPLWPETIAAVRQSLTKRPQPADESDAGLVFITKYGGPWADKKGVDSTLSKELRKLLNSLGINGHRNFYGLRRTFETIGGEARDQVAVDAIMGHARDDMASVYRERISDERLRAVVEHVRQWLFPSVQLG